MSRDSQLSLPVLYLLTPVLLSFDFVHSSPMLYAYPSSTSCSSVVVKSALPVQCPSPSHAPYSQASVNFGTVSGS